jgi:hypothetical protein
VLRAYSATSYKIASTELHTSQIHIRAETCMASFSKHSILYLLRYSQYTHCVRIKGFEMPDGLKSKQKNSQNFVSLHL